ncbi:MAG: response regulator transcription factor [Candidatus Saccharimonadales bacterium]
MAQILLIEPDKILAEIYRDALESAGYKVSVCFSAQSAILSADEIKPSLVIMELQLVGHSGIEFLYEFRSYIDWQNIPVIALTTVPANEFADSQRLLMDELNIAMYLYKPQTSLKKILRVTDELTPIPIKP